MSSPEGPVFNDAYYVGKGKGAPRAGEAGLITRVVLGDDGDPKRLAVPCFVVVYDDGWTLITPIHNRDQYAIVREGTTTNYKKG